MAETIYDMELKWDSLESPDFNDPFQIEYFFCYLIDDDVIEQGQYSDRIAHDQETRRLWAEICSETSPESTFASAFRKYNPALSRLWPKFGETGFHEWVAGGVDTFLHLRERRKAYQFGQPRDLEPDFMGRAADDEICAAVHHIRFASIQALEAAAGEMSLPVEALHYIISADALREIAFFYEIWRSTCSAPFSSHSETESFLAHGVLVRWSRQSDADAWEILPSLKAILNFMAVLNWGPVLSQFGRDLSHFDPALENERLFYPDDPVKFRSDLELAARHYVSLHKIIDD